MNLSLILCTHNPREDYLKQTLEALKVQTLPKEEWELLLIDNGCRESLANNWDLSWHPQARHIREDELGLTPARLRGIKESKGDLLVFVDDDNVLDAAYLLLAGNKAKEFPQLGVWGGRIVPQFEIPPPKWIMDYLPVLAVRDVAVDRRTTNPLDLKAIPWGAGLCVRREIGTLFAKKCAEQQIRSLGRTGRNLTSCEDLEFTWLACDAGFEAGVFSQLSLTHLIPKERLTMNYFVRWTEGNAYSFAILKANHGFKPKRSFKVLLRHWRDQMIRLILFRFRKFSLQAAAMRGQRKAFRLLCPD